MSASQMADDGMAHLPKRIVISNGVDDLAEPWMVLCFWYWIKKGRCYALFPPKYKYMIALILGVTRRPD
jgi:hypothetical protein